MYLERTFAQRTGSAKVQVKKWSCPMALQWQWWTLRAT